jgi:hypothetical protein
MGTALAAIIATVITPGAYSVFDVVVGLALASVLLGYYQAPPLMGWQGLRKALALGGVIALIGNIATAYFVQQYQFDHDAYLQACPDVVRRDYDRLTCVADQITVDSMPKVSLLFFLIGTVLGLWLQYRARKCPYRRATSLEN